MSPVIFRRYIGRDILRASFFVLLSFISIFIFFDLIAEIDEVLLGAYAAWQAVFFVMLGLPSRAVEIAPVAVLIGTLWVLSKSAYQSEFTVFRISGLIPRELVLSILSIGLPLVLLTAFLTEIVAPAAEKYRTQLIDRGIERGQARSGHWFRDSAGVEKNSNVERFVNIRHFTPDRFFEQIAIYEFGRDQRFIRFIEAKRGSFISDSIRGNFWRLEEVAATQFPAEGTVQVFKYSGLTLTSSLLPETIGALMTPPDRMSSLELYRYIEYLKQNKQQTERYEISLWKRLVYPWVIWVMMLLALPVAFLQARSGTVGARVFAGILVGVGFHLLNSLFAHLGVLTTWPAPLMALFPSLMALGLAGFFLYWVQYR